MKLSAKSIGAALGFFATVACAQTVIFPPQTPGQLDPLLQLMMTQPSIDVTSNIQVSATFNPPFVRPGEKSVYRVTFNALSDSVEWPEKLNAPVGLGLRWSARGQTLIPTEGKLKPETAINYHARAAEGSYEIPSFEVQVYGRRVMVPAARLVVSPRAPEERPPSIELEVTSTNVYVGQPVNLRALLKAAAGNILQGVHELRFNGEGFLVDQTGARQSINMMQQAGGTLPAYTYETTLTPLRSGDLQVSAQGFTGGNRFAGPIVIQGQVTIPGGPIQYVLIDSEPLTLRVQPLPRAGQLPGFTGAIGEFASDPPRLSTNQVRVGEIVKLSVTFRGPGNLARLVPPRPPTDARWQIFDGQPDAGAPQPGAPPANSGSSATFTFTLIPLTTGPAATPAIPFSYFDPDRKTYVDLTIPPLPIRVEPGAIPVDAPMLRATTEPTEQDAKKLRLSDLSEERGWTATSLAPLQRRGWFIAVQVLPLIGFLALWKWDRRRRYLEQHPEVVLRRRARRDLRREKRRLRAAVATADERAYVAAAVRAMQIAVAPNLPAEPRALVSRDVLEAMNGNRVRRELVENFFAASDASQFSSVAAEPRSMLKQHSEFERLLEQLEARL